MPRLVRLEATGPIRIDPKDFPRDAEGNLKPMFICACGLTRSLPFCDGTHKACRASEQPGRLYVYDAERKTVIEERPDGL
jgi:CDGSH-type Zn-finger protein